MKNARNFYYRLICACLVLAVIGSNTLVFASSPDDIHSQENNFCQELSGIPIFFDFVAPINSDSKQSSLSLSDSNEIYTDTEAIAGRPKGAVSDHVIRHSREVKNNVLVIKINTVSACHSSGRACDITGENY